MPPSGNCRVFHFAYFCSCPACLVIDPSLNTGKIPITLVTCFAQCNLPINGNLTEILSTIDFAYNLGITSACTSGRTIFVSIVTALATNNNRDIAFANLIQYLGRIKSWIGFVDFIFGDKIWLQTLTDFDWSMQFLAVSAEDGDSSFQISPAEFLTLRLPYSYGDSITTSHMDLFIQRYYHVTLEILRKLAGTLHSATGAQIIYFPLIIPSLTIVIWFLCLIN